jgi:hypothetical protein
MNMQARKILSIIGCSIEDERGCDAEMAQAGTLYHKLGIGHIRVQFEDGSDVYIKGSDLSKFAMLYRQFGDGAISTFRIDSMQ